MLREGDGVLLCFLNFAKCSGRGGAASHELQLAEHRGMQDEAAQESLVSFGAAGVTLQSSWSIAQEMFFS